MLVFVDYIFCKSGFDESFNFDFQFFEVRVVILKLSQTFIRTFRYLFLGIRISGLHQTLFKISSAFLAIYKRRILFIYRSSQFPMQQQTSVRYTQRGLHEIIGH